MEYKLFFSYQSDTADECDFILSALNQAKASLKDIDGITLLIDHSMRGVAGNPDLLGTMLSKGEECDIFLADITNVITFDNSKGVSKSIPNPNVMLELGHAWNFQGFNHTIFVQNSRYGAPDDNEFPAEYPVDLQGLRHAIKYNLQESGDKEYRKIIRKKLSDDLINAIKEVIKSVNVRNSFKYEPFEKICNYKTKLHSIEFIPCDFLNTLSTEICSRLKRNQNVILTGKRNCGKSRIILETINNKFSEQERNDIYICSLRQSTPQDILAKLRKLKSIKRPSIFIIDDCTDELYKNIDNEVLYDTLHNCVCIIEKSDYKELFVKNEEYITQLVLAKDPENVNSIIAECGYNISNVVGRLLNMLDNIDMYDLSGDKLKVIEYISLFSKIGYVGIFNNEFIKFCELFSLDNINTEDIINDLILEKYLILKGGFIYVEADKVAEKYSSNLWDKGSLDCLDFNVLEDLQEWFVNRQVNVAITNSSCKQYLNQIIKTQFRDIEFVDNKSKDYILYRLAPLFSKEIISSFEILLRKKPLCVFNHAIGIIWALDEALKYTGLFDRSIMIMLDINKRNNDTSCRIEGHVTSMFVARHGEFNNNANIKTISNIYKQGEFEIIKNI